MVVLFFFSCGIDVFIYLYPVVYRDHTPSSDELYNYFYFRTSDTRNTSEAGAYFKGFEIYYRLYTHMDDLDSKRASINTYNSNNPSLAYNYLITTQKYRRMLTSERTATPVIEGDATNRMIAVRLFPYDIYTPGVYIDEVFHGIPRRSVPEGVNSDAAHFDFDEVDSDDPDTTWTTFDYSPNRVYMHTYVLAYGYDESYKQLYSELFELGYITIEDN